MTTKLVTAKTERHGGRRKGAGRPRLPRPPRLSPFIEAIPVEFRGQCSETACEYAGEAIGYLVGVMRDRSGLIKPELSVVAARYILDLAKMKDAEHEAEQQPVSDLELARWILSVLERAADQQQQQQATALLPDGNGERAN